MYRTRILTTITLLLASSVALGQATKQRSAAPSAKAGSKAKAKVISPEEHLGRPVGRDFELADWKEVTSYFRKLDLASDNVVTEKAGTSTEGRDFLIATITSAENFAQLDQIKANARILADPRGKSAAEKARAVREGKVILMISCAIHATECASPQMAMEFAYTLATSNEEPWATARKNMVVVLAPSTNPDGLDHVVEWYRQNVNTPYEAAGLPKLYQYYTGHDNNRDWFMLTQAETRIMTHQLYSVWLPNVYWDVHQQGTHRERMFIPPFRDPLNPNLDPALIAGIDALCSRAMMDLTRAGISGIATGIAYDMWWNGGNRNVPVRHNIIGLLTEAASVNIASPIFITRGELNHPFGDGAYRPANQFPMPWPGGWWRLRNIIDYEFAFGKSLLGTLGSEPQLWLRTTLEAAERSIAAGDKSPSGWVIPSDNRDPAAVRRLIDVLAAEGVEIHVSRESLNVDGRQYPAGSIVIKRAQPYGNHVKDLFDIQRYPDTSAPYDVAGWTLPLLLGVRRVEIVEPLDAQITLARVTKADEAVASFEGDRRAARDSNTLSSWDSNTWKRLIAHLAEGGRASFAAEGESEGLFVLEKATQQRAAKGQAPAPPEEKNSEIRIDKLPRFGVYSPWSGHIDEGWLRCVLDDYKVPYKTVRNETLRAGNLLDFIDVLILPGVSGGSLEQGREPGSVADRYARGLAPEGVVAVDEFVRQGGTLIATEGSGDWAIDAFQLPLVNVTRSTTAKGFSCPGSVLRGVVVPGRMTAGLPDSVALFFSGSDAWRRSDEKKPAESVQVDTLVKFAPTQLLMSGWISNSAAIEGHIAWAQCHVGKGRIHLFGVQPHYRAWSQSAFPLLFRAMLLKD